MKNKIFFISHSVEFCAERRFKLLLIEIVRLCVYWKMFLFIAIAVVYVLYKWLTKNDDYFLKKGIPFEKPLPIFGNFLGFMMQRETLIDIMQRNYDKYKKSK